MLAGVARPAVTEGILFPPDPAGILFPAVSEGILLPPDPAGMLFPADLAEPVTVGVTGSADAGILFRAISEGILFPPDPAGMLFPADLAESVTVGVAVAMLEYCFRPFLKGYHTVPDRPCEVTVSS